MNKKQMIKAVATGVVIAELAVLDYAAVTMVRNGFSVEVSVDDLEAAERVALQDMAAEGVEIIGEVEP